MSRDIPSLPSTSLLAVRGRLSPGPLASTAFLFNGKPVVLVAEAGAMLSSLLDEWHLKSNHFVVGMKSWQANLML